SEGRSPKKSETEGRINSPAATGFRVSGSGWFRASDFGVRSSPSRLRNAHPVEAAIDEAESDRDEEEADAGLDPGILHRHGDLDREQAEKRGEFDHRIEGNARGV